MSLFLHTTNSRLNRNFIPYRSQKLVDPIPFITTGESGSKLLICEEALKLLENETREITVVCIVGPYRTGKSYLLNCIIGEPKRGFALGKTVEAATKGIWMWLGDFFDDPSRALLLLDTEGLLDPAKGDKSHDTNLFAVSLFLSSVFVYNTNGIIDAGSLDALNCATKINEYIKAGVLKLYCIAILSEHLQHFCKPLNVTNYNKSKVI
jgi:hypothetical protein